MSKAIRSCIFSTSLRDWFRILAPLSQPIRCKTKTTFSRALGSLVVFTLGSHWLLKIFSFIHIGRKALKLRLASCACMRTSTQVFEFTTLNRQKDENQLKNLCEKYNNMTSQRHLSLPDDLSFLFDYQQQQFCISPNGPNKQHRNP